MNIELLYDIYTEVLCEPVVHMLPTRKMGIVSRTLVTDTARCFNVIEQLPPSQPDTIEVVYWVDKTLNFPGWITSADHYDLVACESSSGLDIYPFVGLRRAWAVHGRSWVQKFKRGKEKRDGFEHQWVSVPREVALEATSKVMQWQLSKQEA